jgi:hypothetical protein
VPLPTPTPTTFSSPHLYTIYSPYFCTATIGKTIKNERMEQEKVQYTPEEINLLREIKDNGVIDIPISMDKMEPFLHKTDSLPEWTIYSRLADSWKVAGSERIEKIIEELEDLENKMKQKAESILDKLNIDRGQELTLSDIELLKEMKPEKEPTEKIMQHFNGNYREIEMWGERTGIVNELFEALGKRDDREEAMRNNVNDLSVLEKRLKVAESSLYSAIDHALNKIDLGQSIMQDLTENQSDNYINQTIKNESIMNENDKLPDPEVLLLKDKESNEVNVVKGVNADGKVEKVKPTAENEPDFMILDKNSDVLENFWKNFKRQFDNPTEFFKIPLSMLSNMDKDLDLLQQFKIDPPKKEHAISADSVNWDKFKELGISKQFLEFKGQDDTLSNLDRMLNYQRTNLIPVSLKVVGMEQKLPTSARISLKKEEDGTFSPKLLLWKQKPDLKEYRGVQFTDEDRENFLKYGNLGRIVEAEFAPGVKTPVMLTLDKQTNHILACDVANLKVPDTYKGITLSEEQKRDLGLGKRVEVKDMISTNPKVKDGKFTGYVQFNADKRYFELSFDESKQSQKQTEVPKTFRKVELTEEQRNKLSEGKTIYIDGLIDKNQKPYSGYITWNKEAGKLDFMFAKEYKEKLAAGKVTPDDAPKKTKQQSEKQDKSETKKTKGHKR